MITGDRSFGPGNQRYELQRSIVEELRVLYWGRGDLWFRVPEGQFDVVTSQDPFARGLLAWYVARKKGARLNIQVHADLSAQGFLRRALARFVLRRADSIRVVSGTVKDQVLRFGVRGKVSVLPVFVDVEAFRALARKPHEGKVLLWIGRFEPEKNPFEALRILKEVRESGVAARLIMLGAGSLAAPLREQAEGLPVEFPGWQDPRAYLQEADVVISTSPHESWGASIVEALAAGVPVVAYDVGIAREAGAAVVPRERFVEAVVGVLRSGVRGKLMCDPLSKDAWVKLWRSSLELHTT